MTWRVELGDSREQLRALDDASVDAVVTDPPYELGFMGKAWDSSGIAYDVGLWREVLRVLKPGGHLLAFGGTRTYHRMAVAIEDAGFEIRDSIHWMYGSGFPKSLDVSKAIDKRRDDRADVLRVTAWIRERRDAAGVTNAEIDAAFGFCGMAGHWTSSASQPSVPTLDQVPTLISILGVSEEDVPAEIRRLLFELNGRKGQPGEAWHAREVTGTVKEWTNSVSFAMTSRDGLRRDKPATDDARTWLGWGTALKPSHEPVVVARKPLDGTVAANVLAHGTGALNIDGCRIEWNGPEDAAAAAAAAAASFAAGRANGTLTQSVSIGKESRNGTNTYHPDKLTGRWPSNVIFSHLPECGESCAEGCAVAELDAQSGETVSTSNKRMTHGTMGYGGARAPFTTTGYDDTGGASRFFPAFRYQAKPSRAERDQGLSGFMVQRAGGMTATVNGSMKTGSGNDRETIRANVHPTVKPVELMRWLVRLVTPPGGVVLDPFTGSGTTGCAAVLERCSFVGVELSEEYRAIACARIKAAEAGRPCEQLDLFGGW